MGVEPTFARNAPVWPLTALGRLPEEAPDPSFFLPEGALEKGAREAFEGNWLRDQNPVLPKAPVERLGPAAIKTASRIKWRVAIAASIVFHAGVAWFFLDANRDDVLIEGSENAGITMLGNATEDSSSAGAEEVDATQVTIIDMVQPKPVQTVTAEAVPVAEAADAEPVETAEAVEETVAEAPPTETVQAEAQPITPPVEATPVQREKPVEAIAETPPAAAQPVEDPATPVIPSDTPEILAVEKIAPIEDETAVVKPAEAVPVEAVETVRELPRPVDMAKPVEVSEAVPAEPAETVRELPRPVETVKETPPEPKPVEKKAETKPVEKKKPEKKAEKKAVEKPAEKAAAKAETKPKKKPAKAGSGGSGQADAKRGADDGQENGTTAAKGKNGKSANAGNAAVSNYPGKVVSKLRRSLRYPKEGRSRRLTGQVQVAFTVSANGSVSGVRVVGSSGSPILDKAALETVRRAAPFPSIPADAGRASWPFTVPLAFRL